MNISIRMLKIVSILLWMIIVFFSITLVLSVMNLGITLGEVKVSPLENGIEVLLPFSINNNGYYEITNLNITSISTEPSGKILDISETIISSISQGTNISEFHRIVIDFDSILSLDSESFLVDDSEFNIEIFAGLNFANALPVQLSTNTSIPWGAPFSDLTIGEFNFLPQNLTHVRAEIPLSFENHAIVDLSGTLKIELLNDLDELLTSGEIIFNVPSYSNFSDMCLLTLNRNDVPDVINSCYLHMVFETPMFTLEWDKQYG